MAQEELGEHSHNATVMQYAADIALYTVAWGRTLFQYDAMHMGTHSGTAHCPCSLFPKQTNLPCAVTAHVWLCPAVMATTFAKASSTAHCPCSLFPKQTKSPRRVTAQA